MFISYSATTSLRMYCHVFPQTCAPTVGFPDFTATLPTVHIFMFTLETAHFTVRSLQ